MPTDRALKALYRSAFIAGATLGGGPPAGAAAAAFLETDLGQAGIDNVTTWTTKKRSSSSSSKKVGKSKRKPSAYNKKYASAYKSLKKKHPRSSFAVLAKKAHKAVKK